MNILIVGANFRNKGAQSMLFITAHEVLSRNPKAELYFETREALNFNQYVFRQVAYTPLSRKIALCEKIGFSDIIEFSKDLIKKLIGRKSNFLRYNEIKNLMTETDIIIDISGFNLGKKWDTKIQEAFLDNIRLAKKYNIPIVLMPQSFGSFDYPPEKQHILRKAAELLPYAKKIFAREKEGCQMLSDTFHLSNIELSTDLVLQNKNINLNNIFKNPPAISVPDIESGSVGIIPNKQCFNHGDKDKILKVYKAVINKLADEGKKIFIFRHSSEDLEICKNIYALCADKATILENDFSCLEYDEFVKKFDFVICSRYHGIVHAYRNNIPCVLLGWAIKYKELSELLSQSKYSFDVTDSNLSIENVVNAVAELCKNFKKESLIIEEKLKLIQQDNCFDKIIDWIKR